MIKFRFTIGRLMVVVAVVAGLLAFWRTVGGAGIALTGLLLLGGMIGVGYFGLRRRPRLLAPVVWGTYLVYFGLAVLAGGLGLGRPELVGAVLIFGSQPIIFGGSVAWLNQRRTDTDREGPVAEAFTMLLIVAPSLFCVIGGVLLAWIALALINGGIS